MRHIWGAIVQKISTGFEKIAHSVFMPSARTWLLLAFGTLLLFSLMMVASASIPYAINKGYSELKYFWSQLGYMLIAFGVAIIIYQVPLQAFYSYEKFILPVSVLIFVMLGLTLLSPQINGAKRWLSIAGFSFQPAEFVKVFLVLLVAEYIHRRSGELKSGNTLVAALRLMIWYAPIFLLLYLQPDHGAIIVLGGTLICLFWVAGVPIAQFVGLFAVLGGFLVASGLQAQYRRNRIMSFLQPFDDTEGASYQLSRSLVAFARGETTGVGYGNSIQKLSHLPEAHNDFLLAITGEEFGFFGVVFVLVLEFIVVLAIMRISYKALTQNQLRLSYTCFGFGVLIFGQIVINAGMNLGVLPTKGLTLPFFSYGGSAMLFFVLMIALVLKIDKQIPIIAQNKESHYY